MCRKFARALNKPSRCDLTPIRVKQLFDLEGVAEVFEKLELRVIKGAGGQRRLVYNLADEKRFFLPGGLMFFNATKDPWMRHISRKTQCKYYYHALKKESKYDRDRPQEACAEFSGSFLRRQAWWWEEGVSVHEGGVTEDPSKLQRADLITFICHKSQ